jgi:hypothetical protein
MIGTLIILSVLLLMAAACIVSLAIVASGDPNEI